MLNADNNRIADSAHFAAHNAQVLSNSWGAPPSAVIEQAFTDVMTDGREGLGTVVLFAVGNDNARVPVGDQSTIDGVIGIAASTNVGSRAAYSNFGDAVDSPNADINLRLKRLSVAAPSAGGDSLAHRDQPGPATRQQHREHHTTDIQGAAGFNPQARGGPVADPDYTAFSGTSSSCPLAAGVCHRCSRQRRSRAQSSTCWR
jgi:subtilisin family serine protease